MASQPNVASGIDFNQFRCILCQKYLSVAPIHMLTDQSKQGQNICGRCKIPQGTHVSQNVAFEAIAQYLEFPCSNSINCSIKLRWDEVEAHEELCGVNTVLCNICNSIHAVTKIEYHFAEQHKEKLIYNLVLAISERDVAQLDTSNQFLMVTSNEPYLITFAANKSPLTSNVMLKIKVMALLESFKFRTFTVTFSTKHNMSILMNKPVSSYKKIDSWVVGYTCNLSTWKKLFLPDEKNLKITIRLDEVTEETAITNKAKPNVRNKDMKETSTLFDSLAQELECPICVEIMNRNIIVCENGHSICEICKDACGTVCPICKCLFKANRNFALEKVCEKLKDFVI